MRTLILAFALICAAGVAHAAGIVPAVNTDMGCTTAGQTMYYNGSSLACGVTPLPATTVGSLPSCTSGTKGTIYLVTDALTPVALAGVTGGGAVVVSVLCNGTAWIVQ